MNKFRAQVKRISGEGSLRQHFPTSKTWRGNSCAVGPGERAVERTAGKYPANALKSIPPPKKRQPNKGEENISP